MPIMDPVVLEFKLWKVLFGIFKTEKLPHENDEVTVGYMRSVLHEAKRELCTVIGIEAHERAPALSSCRRINKLSPKTEFIHIILRLVDKARSNGDIKNSKVVLVCGSISDQKLRLGSSNLLTEVGSSAAWQDPARLGEIEGHSLRVG